MDEAAFFAATAATAAAALNQLKWRKTSNSRTQGRAVHRSSFHRRHAEQAEDQGHQGSEDDSLHFMHPAKLNTQKDRRNPCERQATWPCPYAAFCPYSYLLVWGAPGEK
jgi:hypothetical protein